MRRKLTRIFSRHRAPIIMFVLASLFSTTGGVEACGPFFINDVFVRTSFPDDLGAFNKGRLGLLQRGFDSDQYAVAWRYLTGGSLNQEEQAAVTPPSPNPDLMTADQWPAQQRAEQAALDAAPPKQWLKARAEFAGSGPAPSQDQSGRYFDGRGNIVFPGDYLNCPDAAFTNAVLTLRKRASAWGKGSPVLADWIRAQDVVFSNCDGEAAAMPAAAPAGGPALLRADRAYQTAAATFYAKKFDEAAQQFAAIAADQGSPWHDWGAYLAARATVRKAFAMGGKTDPYSGDVAQFDTATMQRAQKMLESLLAASHPAPSREAVESELDFIRIRAEPAKRIAEICAALQGPGHDPRFAQDLADLNWVLVKGALGASDSGSANSLLLQRKDLPPLLSWIAAWRGIPKPAETFALWQQSQALPWLVVTLAKARPADSLVPELLSEAAKVQPSSPAYPTVFYHHVRLLIQLKRLDEARALLDPALDATRSRAPDSWRNALLAERMAVARDFNEFLTYAPRTVLESGSQAAGDLQGLCATRTKAKPGVPAPCPELKEPEFDADATEILNRQMTLAKLIEAAKSPTLPANLRQELAIVAWTRAVMEEDDHSAAELAPLLPTSLGIKANSGVGFAASVAILRNEGVRPYLEPGIPRVASYSVFDDYRDNWWCTLSKDLQPGSEPSREPPLPSAAGILSDAERAQGSSEFTRLAQLPDSSDLLGQRVLAYAKAHPEDSEVPEALHLVVRSTRYGCAETVPRPDNTSQGANYSPTGKAAFQLLHKEYPESPWAAKTPYFY